MKKIINTPDTLMMEMINGIVLAHPELELINKYKVIKKKKMNDEKVTLISGGGSGHEPAHAGFIGKGMLDAAVCGEVFASPSQIQVYQAIKKTQSSKGTLLIIKNYSGDIMNFKNAAHLAKEDGAVVDYVKVEDDIAVEDSLYTVGRRGVAGTVLVHKIAGAAAEEGRSLSDVKTVAQKAADNVRSIGIALTSGTVPAKGTPTFKLEDDEMEYGVGIHGEPGIRKEKMMSASQLAERMVKDLLKDLNVTDNNEEELVVLINGFGATPLQELYLFNNEVARELSERNIKICRTFVGNYMTSVDMAGVSVSLMKLDEELKSLINKESDTPAFKVSGPVKRVEFTDAVLEQTNQSASFKVETDKEYVKISNKTLTLNNMIYLVDKMSEIIIENEGAFNELDTHAGDGDFGMSISNGFKQLKREWDYVLEQSNDIGEFLEECSLIIMENCGGASGPIWGSAFRAAGKKVEGKKELSVEEFSDMIDAAVKGIQSTGERSFGKGAEVGDKTLIDALVPCQEAWAESAAADEDFKTTFKNGASAAVKGAKNTEDIVARMGRAGTVGERSIGHPDAGAFALGTIFTELSKSIQ
ncbi:dihydroxyacetone kinase subunit DhaK [Alkalibacterium kapii]|uniref:phosphoenolpyruvate--glycerone phosphotransferase n=1 Tax=Alkalibacterium kapii TaxID=426704 RepID=A0A511AXN5_9LACT|nr:dihydroxyacetone kinase subunit DhaK [Alkalibacterium kapii]GEK91901.1 dihydroxyacetone kinase [Alkalibacterium kapii]